MFEILLAFTWVGGWIAASVWFRRANGKPIMPMRRADAEFCEGGCSGRSLRNIFTRLGGARNCLLVQVSGDELIITPCFPFTLLFLPELFGLDLRTSTASIASVEPMQRLWSRMVRVSFHSADLAPIELKLHDERRFLESLGRRAQFYQERAFTAPDKPRRRYKNIFSRLFMVAWGAGALVVALSGLSKDIHFRREGIETIGIFDGHTGIVGNKNDFGILSYTVGGKIYHLTSLRGNGFYKLGSTAKLFYLPDDAQYTREAAYLPFDLLFLFLGLTVLTLSLFGGRIMKRIWG